MVGRSRRQLSVCRARVHRHRRLAHRSHEPWRCRAGALPVHDTVFSGGAMPGYLTELFSHIPAVIDEMGEVFDSHELINRLMWRQQRLFVEALYEIQMPRSGSSTLEFPGSWRTTRPESPTWTAAVLRLFSGRYKVVRAGERSKRRRPLALCELFENQEKPSRAPCRISKVRTWRLFD